METKLRYFMPKAKPDKIVEKKHNQLPKHFKDQLKKFDSYSEKEMENCYMMDEMLSDQG